MNLYMIGKDWGKENTDRSTEHWHVFQGSDEFLKLCFRALGNLCDTLIKWEHISSTQGSQWKGLRQVLGFLGF